MKEYLGMTQWVSLACQNPEPHEHKTIEIDVDLSERHGYMNFSPIPERLWVEPFKMTVWDWESAAQQSVPKEGQWCPMRCAISQTIVEQGIWEPPETLALLNVFDIARQQPGEWMFMDIGAQLGWFSMLAQRFGFPVMCIEGDPEVAAILRENLNRYDDPKFERVLEWRVGPDMTPMGFNANAIIKIDIEGAEQHAIDMLEPALRARQVKAMLVETTPRFGVDVKEQARLLMTKFGFKAYFLPHILDRQPKHFDELVDLERAESPGMIYTRAMRGNQINVLYLDPDFPRVS